jgi:hypothetical protein
MWQQVEVWLFIVFNTNFYFIKNSTRPRAIRKLGIRLSVCGIEYRWEFIWRVNYLFFLLGSFQVRCFIFCIMLMYRQNKIEICTELVAHWQSRVVVDWILIGPRELAFFFGKQLLNDDSKMLDFVVKMAEIHDSPFFRETRIHHYHFTLGVKIFITAVRVVENSDQS